jgi:hypothetical protein
MRSRAEAHVVVAALLLLAIDPVSALAAPTPAQQNAALATALLTADTLRLGDYAKITMGDGGTTFSDVGYLPVEGFSLGGKPLSLPGFTAPGGFGWGVYFRYSGTGTQTLSASGIPESATYSQLSYQLFSYEGSATFGIDAAGDAALSGTILQSVLLGQGSLIDGALSFVPTSPTSVSIDGTVAATFTPAIPELVTPVPATLTLNINHPPSDYTFTSPSTIEIASASGATAVLDPPAAPIPEPASMLVLGAGLAGLAVGRKHVRGRSSSTT